MPLELEIEIQKAIEEGAPPESCSGLRDTIRSCRRWRELTGEHVSDTKRKRTFAEIVRRDSEAGEDVHTREPIRAGIPFVLYYRRTTPPT